MTPLHIEVLLHCNASALPFPRLHDPAVCDVIQEFLVDGVILGDIATSDVYRTTEKGRAWVVALCAVPPPVQCWKDGRTGELLTP